MTKLSETNIKKLKTTDLRAIMKQYKIKGRSGTKQKLISRIISSDKWPEIQKNYIMPVKTKRKASPKQLEHRKRFGELMKAKAKANKQEELKLPPNIDKGPFTGEPMKQEELKLPPNIDKGPFESEPIFNTPKEPKVKKLAITAPPPAEIKKDLEKALEKLKTETFVRDSDIEILPDKEEPKKEMLAIELNPKERLNALKDIRCMIDKQIFESIKEILKNDNNPLNDILIEDIDNYLKTCDKEIRTKLIDELIVMSDNDIAELLLELF
jgi:hypothetical protein